MSSVLQRVAVYCIALQCVAVMLVNEIDVDDLWAVCCSVLQCVAVMLEETLVDEIPKLLPNQKVDDLQVVAMLMAQ